MGILRIDLHLSTLGWIKYLFLFIVHGVV